MNVTCVTACRMALSAVLLCATLGDRTRGAEEPAQQPPPDPVPGPENIEQQQPAFYVHAETDRRSGEYYEGEQITLRVTSEVDAFLYVIYRQADGQIYLVFPSSGQPDNRVSAGKTVQVPAEGDLFRWTVDAPFGKELMKVIASKDRIAELEKPEMRRKRLTPVSRKELATIAKEVRDPRPADRWSEASLEITTHSGRNPNERPARKRYGVFFGVSAHDLTPLKVAAFGDQANKDLANCAIDAAVMSGVMQDLGKIEVAKTYVAHEASRANLEAAVRQWLPSVSRAGDTVVIYFSGHGSQIPDDNGDEADGLDEVIIPCDTIDLDCLAARRKLLEERKPIDPAVERRLAEAWKLLERSGIRKITSRNLAEANAILLRGTAVSDDLFGHWLQALAGRHVIVILDSCYSGGFAIQGKHLAESEPDGAQPFRWDFLMGAAGRLKDIGQPGTALLTACRASQTALNSHANSGKPDEQEPASLALAVMFQKLNLEKPADNDPMGVMSYFLLNTLLKAEGSLDVEHAGAACAEQMKAYFDSETFYAFVSKINAQRVTEGLEPVELKGHEPLYLDYCRPPALLKP